MVIGFQYEDIIEKAEEVNYNMAMKKNRTEPNNEDLARINKLQTIALVLLTALVAYLYLKDFGQVFLSWLS